MSRLHVVSYTDRHARFLARILRDKNVEWYHHVSRRAQQTIEVINDYKIGRKWKRFYAKDFFRSVLESEDLHFVFGRLGKNGYSSKMFHCPKLDEFFSTDLSTLKSRFVSMDESLLFHRDSVDSFYIPHADTFLTKSRAEYEYYIAKELATDIKLVGHAELDNTGPLKTTGTAVGLLIAAVSQKEGRDISVLKSEFTQWVKDRNYRGKVYLKDHINSTGKFGELSQLTKHCIRLGLRPVVVDKREGLASFARNISHAFVHETINTHLMLKRLGIVSYFYDQAIPEIKTSFIRHSNMPDDTYMANRGRRHTEFEEWMREQFILDGKCSHRMIEAIRG